MSKPQTQTPNSESFFKAKTPIYTREELERKLRELNTIVRNIVERFKIAEAHLNTVADSLWSTLSYAHYAKFEAKIRDLEDALKDSVDELIIGELQLDTDIGKYEREYNVKFIYESERQLGVVLVREDSEVKPVVVWTDYREVGYYEGER
jgi:exonuclease VII small subunit